MDNGGQSNGKAATEDDFNDDDIADEAEGPNSSFRLPLAESTVIKSGTKVVTIGDEDDDDDDDDSQEEDDFDDEDMDDSDIECLDDEEDEDLDDDMDEEDPLGDMDDDDDDTLGADSTEDSLLQSEDSNQGPLDPGKFSKRIPVVQIPLLKLKASGRHYIPPDSPAVGSSPSSSVASGAAPPKRRGRPTKAEMLRREKERQERIARGEPDPPPKRRGRKPIPPEVKARIKEEKKRAKLANKVKKPRGRRAKVLTEDEKAEREEVRKQKYEEFKRAKAEKAAKREQRNLYLREYRKQKKEEEKRQREAYEKRMQELKANFLDENSQLSAPAKDEVPVLDENSQSSFSQFTRSKIGNHEMSQLDTMKHVTAETLFEYRWPLEGKDSEHYFLQEQVCEYLGIKSFKRRYPDLTRRNVDVEERDFLVEMKVVNEIQADLGLTSIPSTQVLDIMSNDFYEKYDEYMQVVSERKDRTIRQTNYSTLTIEKHKFADFVEKAVRSAAAWNKKMNAEKLEKRRAYFDMQTFCVHYPMNNKGRMKPLVGPKLGTYPVALIPGQFVDHFKAYSATQLKYLPLNTALKAPPKPGVRMEDLEPKRSEALPDDDASSSGGSSGSDSDTDSDSSSGSSSSSDSESEEVVRPPPPPVAQKPAKPIDAIVPGAKCKSCLGDRGRNKLGQPEKLLHCSKCSQSYHPTCLELCLELLNYVTSYNWECTECKVCSKCKDHSDEDKMLFCDLCDRGYHNYCVGLNTIPSGRWHCRECTFCVSCGARDPEDASEEDADHKWVLEFKPGLAGNKIYSHTMCSVCHRSWKRGQFCPECNVVFGREKVADAKYANCWICTRQHHLDCVLQATFICSGCQRKTLEKSLGTGNVALLSTGPNTASSTRRRTALLT